MFWFSSFGVAVRCGVFAETLFVWLTVDVVKLLGHVVKWLQLAAINNNVGLLIRGRIEIR